MASNLPLEDQSGREPTGEVSTKWSRSHSNTKLVEHVTGGDSKGDAAEDSQARSQKKKKEG